MSNDPVSLYFHGIPGGAGELALFGSEITRKTAHYVPAPRNISLAELGADRFAQIAKELRDRHGTRPMHLIGFSMGAAATLRVAPHLGAQIEKIDLISAAAPLSLGEYLENMAGAPVFKSARDKPLAFRILSRAQSLMAGIAPSLLYSAVFSSAQGGDKSLRDAPEFRAKMIPIIKECLQTELQTYRGEIRDYVGNWAEALNEVSQPVSLYHGELDNWSPIEMAYDLAEALPNCQGIELIKGASHYSALRDYLQQI